MKRLINVLMLCLGCAGLMLQTYGCGSSIELSSRKINEPIVIDGSQKDWPDAPVNLEKHKVSLGFSHDETSLYVLLTTYDQQTAGQIMGTGMTVWFDSAGSKHKTFGVHFPIGVMDQERPRREKSNRKNSDQPGQPDQQMAMMSETVNAQLEIVYPDNAEKKQILLPSSSGYNAKLSLRESQLVYELQIPRSAIGDRGIVGVGFETPEITKPQMPSDEEGGPPGGMGEGGPPGGGGGPPGGGGGPPGGGGGPPGGGGGMPGGGGPPGGGGMGSMPTLTPLDVWVQVNLNPVLPEKK